MSCGYETWIKKKYKNTHIDQTGIKITISQSMNGLHWVYKNNKGDSLSVVLHGGSYGNDKGLFETMCSWLPGVQGFLTFGQVQQKINTLKRKHEVKK